MQSELDPAEKQMRIAQFDQQDKILNKIKVSEGKINEHSQNLLAAEERIAQAKSALDSQTRQIETQILADAGNGVRKYVIDGNEYKLYELVKDGHIDSNLIDRVRNAHVIVQKYSHRPGWVRDESNRGKHISVFQNPVDYNQQIQEAERMVHQSKEKIERATAKKTALQAAMQAGSSSSHKPQEMGFKENAQQREETRPVSTVASQMFGMMPRGFSSARENSENQLAVQEIEVHCWPQTDRNIQVHLYKTTTDELIAVIFSQPEEGGPYQQISRQPINLPREIAQLPTVEMKIAALISRTPSITERRSIDGLVPEFELNFEYSEIECKWVLDDDKIVIFYREGDLIKYEVRENDVVLSRGNQFTMLGIPEREGTEEEISRFLENVRNRGITLRPNGIPTFSGSRSNQRILHTWDGSPYYDRFDGKDRQRLMSRYETITRLMTISGADNFYCQVEQPATKTYFRSRVTFDPPLEQGDRLQRIEYIKENCMLVITLENWIPVCRKITHCTSFLSPDKRIDSENWAVTLVDTGGKESSGDIDGWLGHSAIIIEKFENGQFAVIRTEIDVHKLGGIQPYKSELSHDDFLGKISTYRDKTLTRVRSKDSILNMLETIDLDIEMADRGRRHPYHAAGRIGPHYLESGDNCITWSLAMLSLAGVKIPQSRTPYTKPDQFHGI